MNEKPRDEPDTDAVPKVAHDSIRPVFTEEVTIYGAPGDGGPISRNRARYEFRRFFDRSRKTQSGVAERTMVFDRDGSQHGGVPWYDEVVTDPETGEQIADKHHPLRAKPHSGSPRKRVKPQPALRWPRWLSALRLLLGEPRRNPVQKDGAPNDETDPNGSA